MIFRLSGQLARKVKQADLESVPLHGNPLLDWSMQTFAFNRKQHVLVCNTKTLYSTVFLGAGLNQPHALAVTALRAIAEQLEWDHLLERYQARCPTGSMSVHYAKSLNRSVVGSMNEQILLATHVLADGENLAMVSAMLNQNLLSALKEPGSQDYGQPREVMERLLT